MFDFEKIRAPGKGKERVRSFELEETTRVRDLLLSAEELVAENYGTFLYIEYREDLPLHYQTA